MTSGSFRDAESIQTEELLKRFNQVFLLESGGRDAAVRAFSEMLERARKQDGGLDLSISADALDAERVNVLELWRDQESLDAWRKVAKPPPGIKIRQAHVKLYRTDRAEKPF